MGIYKEVEQGSGIFEKKLINLGTTDLSGTSLKFSKGDRNNLLNYNGNLFMSFNLPVTASQKNKFTGSGLYAQSAFQHLNKDNIVIIEIPKNTYGELIDAKSIELKVPILSGSTRSTYNCYATFFNNTIISEIGDQLYSDPNQVSSEFGQPYNAEELPGQSGLITPKSGYTSNIAYLFCDNIKKPRGDSGYTWNSTSKYFVGQYVTPVSAVNLKWTANYTNSDGRGIDQPVGIVYLDKGFIVLTNETIVNNFDYGIGVNENNTPYTGDANFDKIHFTGGSIANLSFSSFNTEFIQRVSLFALPNEFFTSNNPTFKEAYGDANVSNQPVAITEVGLYNSNYELIGIAKTSEPVLKEKNSVLTFDVQIKI